ncbi:MAG: adenosylcobinamide-GDP ribazoletransferase [Candidatus Hydrothermarchaeaceae archaeon]
MVLKGIRSVLSFLTVLPIRDGNLEDAARNAWLFPAVGGALALLSGAVGWVLDDQLFYPPHVSAAVALFILLLLTGFHHLDGLLDVGDGLMLRGTREERLRAMRDANTGAGGFGLAFFVLLTSYVALIWAPNLLYAIVAAEALAKLSMVLGLYAGTSSHQGMGSTFLSVTRGNKGMLALAFLLATPIAVYPLGLNGVILMVATAFFALLLVRYFTRAFGGIGGDALGAINELTRMMALLVLLALI